MSKEKRDVKIWIKIVVLVCKSSILSITAVERASQFLIGLNGREDVGQREEGVRWGSEGGIIILKLHIPWIVVFAIKGTFWLENFANEKVQLLLNRKEIVQNN
jgi:hypothetical protein